MPAEVARVSTIPPDERDRAPDPRADRGPDQPGDPSLTPAPPRAAGRGARGRLEVRMLFPSDPLAVRSALGTLLRGLSYLDLSEDTRGTLELVLAEAMNNVVEHAHGDNGEGVIEVAVCHHGGALTCELIDDGIPMPDGDPPAPDGVVLPEAIADMPEGGFGWLLIRELARDLDYARAEGRNRLTFRLDAEEDA